MPLVMSRQFDALFSKPMKTMWPGHVFHHFLCILLACSFVCYVDISSYILFKILYFPLQDLTVLRTCLRVYYNNNLHCQKKYRQSDLPVFCSTVFWGGGVWDSISFLIPREVQPCAECRIRQRVVKSDPHCNGNSVYIFLFWKKRGLSPNFHIHVSLSDWYIPRISLHISSSRTGRPIVGIYNSLTDTCM